MNGAEKSLDDSWVHFSSVLRNAAADVDRHSDSFRVVNQINIPSGELT